MDCAVTDKHDNLYKIASIDDKGVVTLLPLSVDGKVSCAMIATTATMTCYNIAQDTTTIFPSAVAGVATAATSATISHAIAPWASLLYLVSG